MFTFYALPSSGILKDAVVHYQEAIVAKNDYVE